MKSFPSLAAILATLHLVAATAPAADPALAWPRFRGPNGSGIAADDARPPVEFGPEKNVRWKVAVPSGISSPIIVGDLVVLTAFDQGKLYTIAYRRDDGREAWRAEAPAEQLEPFHKLEGSPAASTPATDGRRIVSYFGSCGLFCYDLEGREQWKFELPPAKMAGDFGTGVSPILVDGLVVLVRDEMQNSRILALDAATGRLKWETKRHSPTSYGTPIVCDTPQRREIVAPGHGRMVAYDLATGAERWSAGGLPAACCASPMVVDGVVYFAGSSTANDEGPPNYDSLLEKLDADKDGALSRAEAEQAFQGFFDNQDINKDGKFTRDEHADGKQIYQTRAAADKYYASPVAAAGNVYLTSLEGAVTVLKAGETKAEVVAKNPKLGERTAATPAIAGDTLYLRTADHLYAFSPEK